MTAATVDIQRVCEQDRPSWRGATWIGMVEDDLVQEIGDIRLDGAARFDRARLLVRRGKLVRGLVEIEVTRGHVDARRLRLLIAALDPPDALPIRYDWPAVTVVLCQRGSGARIGRALQAIAEIDYRDFEVLVIGHSADASNGGRLVDQYGGGRALWLDGMDEGVGRARSRALLVADGSLVAFTDDRVLVDRAWLQCLVAGFARAPDVACVCGLTTCGELSTRWHGIADGLQSPLTTHPEVVRASSGTDLATDLHTDTDGTSRNFAVNRRVTLSVNGWDPTLVRRRPIGGGEDVDLFLRVVHHGRAVSYEPSAVAFSFD